MKFKRLSFILLSILLLSSLTGRAQNNTTRFFYAYTYENITIDGTSGGKAFTASKVTGNETSTADSATFTIDCSSGTTCPIRMTLDGTAPTSSVGMRADYQQSITIYGHSNLVAFRAIRESSTSAIINVTYFR